MQFNHLLIACLVLFSQLSFASAAIVSKDSCTATSDTFVCNRNDGELFLINLVIYVAIALAIYKIFKVVSFYFEECGLPEEEKQRRRSSRRSNAAPLINPDDYVEMNHIKEIKPEVKQTKQPEIAKEKSKKGYVQLNEEPTATALDIQDERYNEQKKKKLREELSSKIKQLGLSPTKN